MAKTSLLTCHGTSAPFTPNLTRRGLLLASVPLLAGTGPAYSRGSGTLKLPTAAPLADLPMRRQVWLTHVDTACVPHQQKHWSGMYIKGRTKQLPSTKLHRISQAL